MEQLLSCFKRLKLLVNNFISSIVLKKQMRKFCLFFMYSFCGWTISNTICYFCFFLPTIMVHLSVFEYLILFWKIYKPIKKTFRKRVFITLNDVLLKIIQFLLLQLPSCPYMMVPINTFSCYHVKTKKEGLSFR